MSSYAILSDGTVIGQPPDNFDPKSQPDVFGSGRQAFLEGGRRLARTVKLAAQSIAWDEVRAGSAHASLKSLQDALSYFTFAGSSHTNIVVETQMRAAFAKVVTFCNAHEIMLPSDQDVPLLLERPIGKLLSAIGIDEIAVGYEFGPLAKIRVSNLLEPDPLDVALRSIAPPELRGDTRVARIIATESLVFRSTEGAYYTVIDGLPPEATAIVNATFDGFWCEPSPLSDWWFA